MRVALDLTPLKGGHAYRGIGSYTRSLHKALRAVDKDNEYLLTTKVAEADADVIHYPYFDLFFLSLPLVKKAPTVVTIHDVIPLVFADYYPPGLRGKAKFWVQKQALRNVRSIITDSDRSKADIVKCLNVDEEKLHRVYLAASDDFSPVSKRDREPVLKRYGLKVPYFLYVGDINYNKNVLGMIKAFANVGSKFNLVMVSKAMSASSEEAQRIRELIDELSLGDRIMIIDSLATDEEKGLRAIYSGASWYVQPSFYEGFGLPVLEAMKCGTPVVSSIGGSLKEVVGNVAVTFDPRIDGGMEKALIKAVRMSDDERKKLIAEAKKHAGGFSWERTALETIEIYKGVVE